MPSVCLHGCSEYRKHACLLILISVHKSQMMGEKSIGMLPGIEMPRMTGSASPSPPIQDRQTLSHTGSQDEDDLFNVGERARQRGEVGY